MDEYAKSEASLIARKLPDSKKKENLLSLSEDTFRDQVIRPLYRRQGVRHLRDTCGADEQGKDCLFVGDDPLGAPMVIAVQTKKGSVTMAGTAPSQNLANIETQLRMSSRSEHIGARPSLMPQDDGHPPGSLPVSQRRYSRP